MSCKKIISVIILLSVILLIFCSCSTSSQNDRSSSEFYNSKKIGVVTGSVFDKVAEDNLKSPKISYFNSNADLAVALETGKIDAYVNDEPIWRSLTAKYPDHKLAKQFSDEEYAFIFKKDDAKGTFLCNQLNEYLAKIKKDGTLKEIDNIWFGNNENLKTVDMNGLTAENGVLSFAVSTDIGAPFAYMKNNSFVGYDVDVAVRFCREYGYGIEIFNNTGAGLIAGVSTGKCDFGASCLTVTEERKESVLFSDADYVGGNVLVYKSTDSGKRITSIEQLYGEKIAVQTGTVFDMIAKESLDDCKIEYYNSAADLSTSLDSGKVMAYVADEPIARAMIEEYQSHRILSILKNEDYAFVFPKINPNSQKLCAEMNDFLSKIKSDGTMNEIDSIWFGSDRSKQKVDRSGLTGKNGTLTMAITSTVGKPFSYVQDNEIVGYDIDMATRFCTMYGYDLKIVDYDASGLFSCLSGGKCDFAASCIAVLDERKETMLFSEPNYKGGSAVVVNDGTSSVQNTDILNMIKESFEKTFIRENRYLLFLSGMETTLFIVLLSLLFGTLFGLIIYFIYYRLGKPFRFIVNVGIKITENTPIVVILMILYYIVFGKVDVGGALVSVIGFTLIFTGSVIGLMKVAVGAVSVGQKEAALALGYSENKTFLKIIFPQAAVHFLPGYKSAVVQLIKGTSIVGYIAVQDLTKVSDIVRSRTYEAFFPLIATALIYFAMAMVMTAIVNRIEININPQSRKKIKILKGVKRK